jgi:NADH-quinone oxidoreductase subunit J
MSAEVIFFLILALGILVSSALVIALRNPINSTVSLICTFLLLSGVYALLSAPFMAIIQVMVYAGAIMVLFLFVIMLLNLGEDELGDRKATLTKILAGVAALGVLGAFVAAIVTLPARDAFTVEGAQVGKTVAQALVVQDPSLSEPEAQRLAQEEVFVDGRASAEGAKLEAGQVVSFGSTRFPGLRRIAATPTHDELRQHQLTQEERAAEGLAQPSPAQHRAMEVRLAKWDRFGGVKEVGSLLYTKWLFPLEITALLLLAAVPGAVILAKRRL